MRSKLVFLLAIIFGLLTALLLYKYLADTKAALENTEYVEIVVAAEDIPAKTRIMEKMLKLKKIPKEYQHPNEILHLEDVVNKILLVPVIEGESIMSNQILGRGKERRFSLYYTTGKKSADHSCG